MRRGFDEEKLVRSSILVFNREVLMRRYQLFDAIIEVSDMVGRGVHNYEL